MCVCVCVCVCVCACVCVFVRSRVYSNFPKEYLNSIQIT